MKSSLTLGLLLATLGTTATALSAQSPLHPRIPLLDATGSSVAAFGSAVSAQRTCGACHDVGYIEQHSTHAGVRGLSCFTCHADTAAARTGLLRVRDPADGACAVCHRWSERTGTPFSAERIAVSGVNIRAKATLDRPFDVHAERLVGCTGCHHSKAHPGYDEAPSGARPEHLAVDPRQPGLGEYLKQPSHQLALGDGDQVTSGCTSCHDAVPAHRWLPHAERHMAKVACESCHIPYVYGRAPNVLDWTLPNAAGEPRREYRGIESGEGSTALLRGYAPALLPTGGGSRRLTPHNLVLGWFWVQGPDGGRVPWRQLRTALLRDGRDHPAVVAALDRDGDGVVAPAERVLTDSTAVSAIAALLRANGVAQPRVEVILSAEALHHGVARGAWANRSCDACHSREAAGLGSVTLGSGLPPGIPAAAVRLTGAASTGRLLQAADGALSFEPTPAVAGRYILGRDRSAWLNGIGMAAVLAVLLGVLAHGSLRLWAHRGAPRAAPRRRRRVYMYGGYERFWHWLQALAILVLLLTGCAIHRPDRFGWLSFPLVVQTHDLLGFLLLANALLAAFYHLASGRVRDFLPRPRGFFSDASQLLAYYGRGIFRHERHPFEKAPDRRLNPLQKVTYLAILNILLPLQVVTGLLIWLGRELALPWLGGDVIALLAPVHALAAWLFAAFLLVHVYLTTTGHTPLGHLQAMVVGWEDVTDAEAVPADTEEEVPAVA